MENKPDKLNYRDMNLRDHFAARAMQGMLGGCMFGIPPTEKDWKLLAALSYRVADAMISQRDKDATEDAIATLQQ